MKICYKTEKGEISMLAKRSGNLVCTICGEDIPGDRAEVIEKLGLRCVHVHCQEKEEREERELLVARSLKRSGYHSRCCSREVDRMRR